jgi:DNA-binding NarL/FixJ family response regulator
LSAVARVRAAGLVTVVVSGEPGIGKSRLLAEAADRLAGRSWRVLRIRADRLERRIPYAALSTALRSVAGDSSFIEGVRRDAVAALDLPSGDATPDPAGTAFGRACATVARLLTALSAAGPLVLAVDDLHELDDDSLALLTVVVHRLSSAPIGLVVAVRSHLAEPNLASVELLERLAESAELVRLDLATLSPADVGAVVARILGAPPDDKLIAEVDRRADGNPYFAAEIAHSLAESRLVVIDRHGAHLTVAPQAVRLTRSTAMVRRVLPLRPNARAVARILAVLRMVGLQRIGVIAQVASLSEAAVAAAFDDLVRAHVVVSDDQHGYRFSHDIVADAVYDEIGPAECRRLHRQVADRLLAERGQGGPVDLLELAWHLSESAAAGDSLAVQVLSEAARHVLSNAPEAAAGFCARALALLKEGSAEHPALLALQCRALARASRPAAAIAPGREALALLPPGNERFRTGTAVLSSLFSLDRIDEAIEVADELVRARSVPAAVRAQRALLLVFAGRIDEALDEADRASSTTPISPAEEVVVLGQLAMLTSMLFQHSETVEFADRALSSSGDSTTLQLQALGIGALTQAMAGLVPEATRSLRRAEIVTQQTDGPHLFRGELGLARVMVDWLGGRWDAALEALRSLTGELAARDQVTLAAALTSIELEIRTRRGELVVATTLAARPPPRARNVASLRAWAIAGYQLARGDVDGARATLAAATDAQRGTPTYIALLLSRLAELELAYGSAEMAEHAVRRLVDTAGSDVSRWARTSVHRTVGIVRADADVLLHALREAEDGGLVFDRALAQLALGELDQSTVAGLTEAHQCFARLGVHGLRRRAARRLHELGAKVPRARSRAGGILTESEEQVARLVQQGMRNREIAAALHFSPRSVEVYLSRIYAKLRVSSRLELARALDAMDTH